MRILLPFPPPPVSSAHLCFAFLLLCWPCLAHTSAAHFQDAWRSLPTEGNPQEERAAVFQTYIPHTLMLFSKFPSTSQGRLPRSGKAFPRTLMLSLRNGKSTFATMVSLAQGTDWAVEATQALGYTSSILAGFFSSACPLFLKGQIERSGWKAKSRAEW